MVWFESTEPAVAAWKWKDVPLTAGTDVCRFRAPRNTWPNIVNNKRTTLCFARVSTSKLNTERNAFIVALRFYSCAYHVMRVPALQDAVGRRRGGGREGKRGRRGDELSNVAGRRILSAPPSARHTSGKEDYAGAIVA